MNCSQAPKETSITSIIIRELAEATLKKTGSRMPLDERPLPQDDQKQRRPDISKAKELLRWTPKIELDKGLDYTITYFSDLLNSSSLTRA